MTAPMSWIFKGATKISEDETSGEEMRFNTPVRTSKFDNLQGFLRQDNNKGVKLSYMAGRDDPYLAKVGRLFHINHPQDAEIHNRVVVIFRTNDDSWSCFGFCGHPDKDDCEHDMFKDNHAKVVSDDSTDHQSSSVRQNLVIQGSRDNVPHVMLKLRDSLKVESDIWINCRQMLDIKLTVNLTPLGLIEGSIERGSLKTLLDKGLDVFNKTYADRDNPRHTPGRISSSPPTSQYVGKSQRQVEKRRRSSATKAEYIGFIRKQS